MTSKYLYAAIIPGGTTTQAGGLASQQQAIQALLGSDVGDVQSIASDPGERTLTVEYPDELADVRAQELRELATGMSQPLPYHAVDGPSPDDKYVSASRADVGPVDPRASEFQRASVTLKEVGTIASHWREVATHPTQADHPWGNTTTAPVGVPSAARKVRWLNRETKATAEPTVQATRAAQHGDVDILDARAAPFDTPSVIYELEMAESAWTDPRLWDDRGYDTIEDSDGATRWQKCFLSAHTWVGNPVLENGLLRLTFDESTSPGITAERWDAEVSSWNDVTLGDSSWELFDIDFRTIGLAQVGGVVEFRDPTQSPTAYHTLGMQLARGAEDVLWSTTSAVPSGLVDLLDPIAADHIYDAYGDLDSSPQRLRAREEVA